MKNINLSQSGKIFLSVVIPAYNEEANIRTGALSSMVDYLEEQDYTWEMVVADDGSTDKTAELAEKFAKRHKNVRVLREPHRGKGGTVIAGVLAAKGEIILFTDTDQSTPLNQIEKFFPKFKESYDIVIGSRAGRKGAPIIRKIMSLGFSILRLIVLRLPYRDTQTGFKAFTSTAAKKVFGKMKVFFDKVRAKGSSVQAGFDVEMLYLARKMHLKIAEVPIEWFYEPGTKKNPIKESWEGLRDLLKVRLNAIQGKYK